MKIFLKLAMMFIAILTSVTFLSSCDPDKEEPTSGSAQSQSSLIGTWGMKEGGEWNYVMFCANGTAYEFDMDAPKVGVDKFEYVYNEKDSKIITISDGDTYTLEVVSHTADKLVIQDEDGDVMVYNKVTSPYTEAQLERYWKGGQQDDPIDPTPSPSSLIGTWGLKQGGEWSYVMFCANGVGYEFAEWEGDLEVDKFQYVYNEQDKKIRVTIDGDVEILVVISLTEDNLIVKDSDGDVMGFTKTTSPYTEAQLERYWKGGQQDDPIDPTPSPSSLIGTWGMKEDGQWTYIMFCDNGVAYFFEETAAQGDVDKGEYVYNERESRIVITHHGDTEIIKVVSLTADKLVLEEDGEVFVFSKVSSPFTEAQLERYYKNNR